MGAGVSWSPEKDVELVVVASPPEVTAQEVAHALQNHPHSVVMDITSVKAAVLKDLLDWADDPQHALSREGIRRYVGTHPMAGREKSGPVAARGELFTSMPWVICPVVDPHTQEQLTQREAVDTVTALARRLGASAHQMSAVKHDQSVALISHLPQIAASLVASRLQEAEPGALALSGNGLRDVTRIAASDPNLWVQILSANSAPWWRSSTVCAKTSNG